MSQLHGSDEALGSNGELAKFIVFGAEAYGAFVIQFLPPPCENECSLWSIHSTGSPSLMTSRGFAGIIKKCIGDLSRSQNSKFTGIIKFKVTYLVSVRIFLSL